MTVILGAVTVSMYALLFAFEKQLLIVSARGGWMFVVLVAIAFAFSMVHGRFTSEFWDTLGVKAKGQKA